MVTRIDIKKSLEFFDLDIEIEMDKELLVIQGQSGAGKTTILDCISGLKSPDKGEIVVEGDTLYSDIKRIDKHIRDRNIGYVFQDYALFPHMTVRENIEFQTDKRSSEDINYIDYIIKSLKIEHLSSRYPHEISGGEKQRVALARAMSIRPKLILLDEPFSALDMDTKKHIYSEFLEFKERFNIGIIMITHNDEEAKLLGDRIVKIRNGSIEE